MKEKEVVIMRGPSGSGKSTYAKKRYFGAVIVSADDFFTDTIGDYHFDPTRLGEAHQDCFCRFIDALITEVPVIVVDNTNIRRWQYDSYLKLAMNYGYEITILEFMPKTIDDLRLCASGNAHDVPAAVVAQMCLDFEEDPRGVNKWGEQVG